MEAGRLNRIPKALVLGVIVILIVDTLITAAYGGWLPIPENVSQRNMVRRVGRAISDYYWQMAAAAGVRESSAVRKALESMEEALQGRTMVDITAALVQHSRAVEAAIASEGRRHQREVILRLIREDPKVRGGNEGDGTIVLSGGEVLE
ncbi:MAG: hypothetical protein GX855_11065, partial [Firmicutes bacterium]|nr:hypothetical protein [Bacillota bacterium]